MSAQTPIIISSGCSHRYIGEFKFVITPTPSTSSMKKFTSLLKTANDSGSFNISLEFKSILQQQPINNKIQSNNEIALIISSDNSAVAADNKVYPVDVIDDDSIKNISDATIITLFAAANHNQSNKQFSNILSCSTPIKSINPIDNNVQLSQNNIDMNGNQNSLTYHSVNCLPEHIDDDDLGQQTLNQIDNNNSNYVENDKKINLHFTPINKCNGKSLRSLSVRRNHLYSSKSTKVLKFFQQKRRSIFRTSSMKCKKKLLRLGFKSNGGKQTENKELLNCSIVVSPSPTKELDCFPLLTQENVKHFYGNDEMLSNELDFSFVCEPSISDVEDDDIQFIQLSTTRKKFPANSSQLVSIIDKCLSIDFEDNSKHLNKNKFVSNLPLRL